MDFTYIENQSIANDEQWRIAVHEAGHAVQAVKDNHVMFEFVEVGPNEHGAVETIGSPLDRNDRDFGIEAIRSWQTFYAAGAAAEHIVFNEVRSHAIRQDFELHNLLNEKLPDNDSTSFNTSVRRAVDTLDNKLVRKVATSLLQCKRLSYEDVCNTAGVSPPWT